MKNVINYYYGIIINEFKKRENNFSFYIGENKFEFIEYYGDINRLLYLYSILKAYRHRAYEIIVNKDNNIITYYENIPYILLKKIDYGRKKLELKDIIEYDCNVYIKGELNWQKLWKEKIDYYEIQLGEIGINYPLLKQSFSYYLGLNEIAICLLNYVDYENIKYCISHKRLEKFEDLFNPLNIIIDNKTRDIAEYIKIKYFNDDIYEEEIISFLKNQKMSKDEMILFLARLIYPSYYFDAYEKIYRDKELEKDLKKIIKKNADYEAFLKKIYNCVKFLYSIPQIEFLEY